MSTTRSALHPDELFGIGSLVDDENAAIASTVKQYVDERIKPHVGEWYEKGELPARELAKELGDLGLLGVMSSQVVQSRDRWLLPDRGVGPVVIVDVDPAGQGCEAVGF